MFSLRQYLLALEDLASLSRTLGEWQVCRREDGRVWFAAGNTAIVFRIRQGGRTCALRCFRRRMHRLRAIYGDRLRERELFLFAGSGGGEWVDAVLDEWIEGETLRRQIDTAAAARDTQRLTQLALAFGRLAAAWVADDWAHGDLKPENIVVDAGGALHLIDFDTLFLPAFAGERSPELGTAAYQHPRRTADDFHAALDDYPAALIATALHALRLRPELLDRWGGRDGLLFDPSQIAADEALREVLALFRERGDAARYRLAEQLLAPTLHLPRLPMLLEAACGEVERETAPAPSVPAGEWPELFVENGRWGYRTAIKTVVPPLYDSGFDFTEGLAAVELAGTWHYIDPTGRTVIHCPGCEAVKPFRDGAATVLRDGVRGRIDRTGRNLE